MLKKICAFFKFEEHSEPITLKKIWVRFIIGLPMAFFTWLYIVNVSKYILDNYLSRIQLFVIIPICTIFVHILTWLVLHFFIYLNQTEQKWKIIISSFVNSFIIEIIIATYYYFTFAPSYFFGNYNSNILEKDYYWMLPIPFAILSIITFWATLYSSFIWTFSHHIKNGLVTTIFEDNTIQPRRRIALIIGNNNYEHYDSLKKQPLNDADAIEERLKTLGAEVVKHTNLNYDGIRRAILDFRQKAKGYDDITFFYAGHGLSYNGKNYLVPTDATPPSTEAELEDLMYAYEQVVKHFADMDGCWNHFFIDACRHTLQFDERGIPTIGDAEKKQLEKWKKRNGKNVCIFFGAAEGESAYNNPKGDNGIFTTALLKHLVQGITLNELIEKVTAETLQISGYKQLPYVTATKVGEYVF